MILGSICNSPPPLLMRHVFLRHPANQENCLGSDKKRTKKAYSCKREALRATVPYPTTRGGDAAANSYSTVQYSYCTVRRTLPREGRSVVGLSRMVTPTVVAIQYFTRRLRAV